MYFNEFDRYVCSWLRNLQSAGAIPCGFVDARDIREVGGCDVERFRQCHFFAGIGGWSKALEIAGWPEGVSVWTGSCPCQPFSSAGKRNGEADERHLWPEFRRLIAECCPSVVFGEQVASPDGRRWLSGVRSDLEALGYAVGCADLPAGGVGSPHKRQRLFWVADWMGDPTASRRKGQREREPAEATRDQARLQQFAGCGSFDGFSHAPCSGLPGRNRADGTNGTKVPDGGGLVDADGSRSQSGRQAAATDGHGGSFVADGGWHESVATYCRDGKYRRVPVPESGVQPLAYGLPRNLGQLLPGLDRVAERAARSNRVGRLKGYGNAIVPQVAALFIRAFMESVCILELKN